MEGKTKKEFRLAISDAEIRPPQAREKKPSVQQSARTDGDEFEWLNRSFPPRVRFSQVSDGLGRAMQKKPEKQTQKLLLLFSIS